MPKSTESPRTTLNPAQLGRYANSAIENAKALIEDACLLLEHGRWPRAYFLSVAGIEEIGKALIAYDGQSRNLRDPAVSATLLRRMSDHASKISIAFMGFVVADARKNTEAAIPLIIALQSGREPSMYTDCE